MADNEVLQNTLITIDELIEEHGGSRKEKITEVFDVIGERFATAPASTNLKYHSCYRGGLMVHTSASYSYTIHCMIVIKRVF